MSGRTLYDKVWDAHVVRDYDDGTSLLYVDRHLVQEVSSPHIRWRGRCRRRCRSWRSARV